jgi:phage terminase large subunit
MIELGYCATDTDTAGYVGNEWDVLFLDEATTLSEYQFYALNSCVRGVNNFPKRTYITCNPGGQGHEWVKRLYIDKEYRKGEKKKDYTFIQAKVYDNTPLLMSDIGFVEEWKKYKKKHGLRFLTEKAIRACVPFSNYVQALSLGSPEMVKAWLEGDWNIYSGKFFGEFDPKVHVIPELPKDEFGRYEIPADWERTAAIDYGRDCFAVLWFAASPDGDVVCYRNYEQENLRVSQAAATFIEMSKDDKLTQVFAPQDMWNTHSDTGRSTADIFAEFGVYFIEASWARISGWLNVREYISFDKEKKDSIPMLRFTENCTHVIKYIQLLQFDIKKPNDVDAKLNHSWTHSTDALRYWCAAWRVAPTRPVKKRIYNFACERPKKDDGGGYEVTESFLEDGYN